MDETQADRPGNDSAPVVALPPEIKRNILNTAVVMAWEAGGGKETRTIRVFKQLGELRFSQRQGIELKAGDRLKQWGLQIEAKGLSKHTLLKYLNLSAFAACALYMGIHGHEAYQHFQMIDDRIVQLISSMGDIGKIDVMKGLDMFKPYLDSISTARENLSMERSEMVKNAIMSAKGAGATAAVAILRPFNIVPYVQRAVGKSSQLASIFLPKSNDILK
ncbi:MAG: hypothetical protein ACMG6E_00035 [Candidatus Roizmanbacteria bacterium]